MTPGFGSIAEILSMRLRTGHTGIQRFSIGEYISAQNTRGYGPRATCDDDDKDDAIGIKMDEEDAEVWEDAGAGDVAKEEDEEEEEEVDDEDLGLDFVLDDFLPFWEKESGIGWSEATRRVSRPRARDPATNATALISGVMVRGEGSIDSADDGSLDWEHWV